MIVSASQTVGLIEIETPNGAGSGSLVALGREELSVGELLAWLTGAMARPLVGDDAAKGSSPGGPINRFAGLLAPEPAFLLAADLNQLETELADAAAQFRLRLTAIESGE
jgi:hypothetical protein